MTHVGRCRLQVDKGVSLRWVFHCSAFVDMIGEIYFPRLEVIRIFGGRLVRLSFFLRLGAWNIFIAFSGVKRSYVVGYALRRFVAVVRVDTYRFVVGGLPY